MLGHDWADPQATYHSYELLARKKVMPHFKGQLQAPRASHDWAQQKRNDLFGRAGEAIMKRSASTPAGRPEALRQD